MKNISFYSFDFNVEFLEVTYRSVLISLWRAYVYMLSVPPGVQAVYRQCTGSVQAL